MAKNSGQEYSKQAIMAELTQYLDLIEANPYDSYQSELDLVKKIRTEMQTMSFAKLCGMLGYFQYQFQAHPDFRGKQIFHREWDN